MAKSIRSKCKQEVRSVRRKQMEANGYFDKSLVKRVAVMEAAMAAAAVPVIEAPAKVESMKVAKPKKVPARKALEMMEVDGESKADTLLKPNKKGGITKKVSATGKKLGKKEKQVFHMGKRTKEKKKAKRSSRQ